MANKMLIDATHPEETRVVVLRGNRVEEFDFETAHRKQLRGNIYLAKVTRVEPSLQAAFVDYGGNRHGFLAFSEIHPDYYQIPVADRQALLEEDARAHHDGDEEEEQPRRNGGGRRRGRGRNRHREARRPDNADDVVQSEALAAENGDAPQGETVTQDGDETRAGDVPAEPAVAEPASTDTVQQSEPAPIGETANPPVPAEIGAENPVAPAEQVQASALPDEPRAEAPDAGSEAHQTTEAGAPEYEAPHTDHDDDGGEDDEEEELVDTVGGADAMEEVMERAPRYRRQYKIQEVIKRRQVMLVQVVKEERGTKGAALTTYLSLAGRYSVLMPNTARGGGISRKITSGEDRKRLREIAEELDVPEGMGVILRTAGASRTKQEVRRDFEYLMRLWETVRDLTLKSTAPTLVYEEGSLAKRSIRDLYSKDIEEIVVAGEGGYRDCKDFMRMLMPSHAKNVKLYRDTQPIFARYGIESQLDAMFSPTVQLKSGGYIVINQTEALVAIDVNSGRSTREHHIEDTALKTNVEAAEEVARQLRLRDLAGLIVIDFIDMDEKRNNRTVESRLKSALRNDRARIQVGRISHFGLMEMSRQRIRTSVLESSTEKCPHCGGTGHVRSVSSVALQLLRALEETLQKGATHNQIVRTRPDTALYVLNHKRAHLRALEERYQIAITIDADATINGTVTYAIDRGEQVMTIEQAKALAAQYVAAPVIEEEEEPDTGFEAEEIEEVPEPTDRETLSEIDSDDADDEPSAGEREDGEESGERENGEREGGRRRRRRRGRGRGGERNGGDRERAPSDQPHHAGDGGGEHDVRADSEHHEGDEAEPHSDRGDRQANGDEGDGEPRRRRRGRRGGRRNRRDRDEHGPRDAINGPHQDHPTEQPHAFEQPEQPYPTAPDIAQETPVPSHEPAAPEPAAPMAQQPVAAAAEPSPRRRSTVREPAPVVSGDSMPIPVPIPAPVAQPAPEPVVVSGGASDDAAKPRRTGWWAKRLLGGDKS